MKEHTVEATFKFYDQFFLPDYESKAKINAARLPYIDCHCFPRSIDDNIDSIMKDMKAFNHDADTCKCV